MSTAAQSQQVLVKPFNWESIFHSAPIDIAKQPEGAIARHAMQGHAQTRPAVYARPLVDFVQDSTACTSVAMNGSIKRRGADMAHAAENVAEWKMYLPEDCVRAMMNAGWHWST
jgi:hypothetical protein